MDKKIWESDEQYLPGIEGAILTVNEHGDYRLEISGPGVTVTTCISSDDIAKLRGALLTEVMKEYDVRTDA